MFNLEKTQTELKEKSQNPQLDFPFLTTLLKEENIIEIQLVEIADLKFYLSSTEHEITCMVTLFRDEDVKPDKKSEFKTALLEINIFTHLAYIAKLDNLYLLKGALPLNASSDDIITLVQKMVISYIENNELIGEFLLEQ